MTSPADKEIVLRASRGWFDLDLADVWRHRDLLILLVNREFISKYKQTILGPAWFVLQPLMMTVVFTVIFGSVAQIPTDGLPPMLFYLAGLLGWTYFAQTFQTTASTLITNAGLFGKVYFPRLVVPLSAVISNFLALALQLITFVLVLAYFKFLGGGGDFGLTPALVWCPLLLVYLAAVGLGTGLWLSALTAKYRDFTMMIPFIVQVWMYATPVIYPLSRVPEKWRWVAAINPMTMPTEAIRLMFLGQGTVSLGSVGLSIAVTAGVLAFGVLLFNRVEKTFVDII